MGDTPELTWSLVEQATAPTQCIGDYLEEGSLTDAERVELIIPQTTLEKPCATKWSYVEPRDTQSAHFGRLYGQTLDKCDGSIFHDGGVPLDQNNPAIVFGAVRLFSPKEILNLLGFPKPYILPNDMRLKHKYTLVGNTIAVTVCSELLILLLLGRDDLNLDAAPRRRLYLDRRRSDE